MTENQMTKQTTKPNSKSVGRNDPCPCGSHKKYKRCCGENTGQSSNIESALRPQVTSGFPGLGQLGNQPGQSPSNTEPTMDPAMMAQASKAIQRLPRGQLQKLQSLMQRAMAGQDVAQEAATLERMLPPEFQEMMKGMAMQMGAQQGAPNDAGAELAAELSIEEAKKLVEDAAKAGKISQDEAQGLLSVPDQKPKTSGFGKLWKGITGKSS